MLSQQRKGSTPCGRSRNPGDRRDPCAGGPFSAYQLAVLGADVIKVDDPNDPDQSRSSGTDNKLTMRRWAPAS